MRLIMSPWQRPVSIEAIKTAGDCSPQGLKVWIDALTSHGFRPVDGHVPLTHAVAVGAALHFRSNGVSKARADRVFRELLRDPPDFDGWVLVDHRDRSPIGFEPPPVAISLKYHARKAPIVFDPAPFIERLGID